MGFDNTFIEFAKSANGFATFKGFWNFFDNVFDVVVKEAAKSNDCEKLFTKLLMGPERLFKPVYNESFGYGFEEKVFKD